MAADPITASTVSGLFNYDVDSDDPFDISTTRRPKETLTRDDKPTLSPRGIKRTANEHDKDALDLDLGLDAEVQIAKKRKPNPKLDEARLLSASGLPKLRALAQSGQWKKKLGLKGKGHEYSDVAKLLSLYQLWLDDLYPRANFKDGLAMVEKTGHGKSMQRVRRDWIDESKPGCLKGKSFGHSEEKRESVVELSAEAAKAATKEDSNQARRDSTIGNGLDDDGDDMFFSTPSRQQAKDNRQDEPEEDELDALLAAHEQDAAPSKPQQREPESEGDDDLDALLAEQSFSSNSHAKKDAMNASNNPLYDDKDFNGYNDEDDIDALDALLAEQESRVKTTSEAEPELPEVSADAADSTVPVPEPEPVQNPESESRGPIFSSSPIPNINRPDELDALLAEQETGDQS